jgi:hypothetical protein
VKVIGKHKEILIELLLYYLVKQKNLNPDFLNNIKEQNEDGQWYTNYYLNNYGN